MKLKMRVEMGLNGRVVLLALAGLISVQLGAMVLSAQADEVSAGRPPKPPGRIDLREVCKKETQENCSKLSPGGGRILACLKDLPVEKLGAECKEGLEQIRGLQEKRQERREDRMEKRKAEFESACGEEAKKLCEGMEPGKGRLAQCLRDHQDQLSEGCKGHLKELRPPRGPRMRRGN